MKVLKRKQAKKAPALRISCSGISLLVYIYMDCSSLYRQQRKSVAILLLEVQRTWRAWI